MFFSTHEHTYAHNNIHIHNKQTSCDEMYQDTSTPTLTSLAMCGCETSTPTHSSDVTNHECGCPETPTPSTDVTSHGHSLSMKDKRSLRKNKPTYPVGKIL